MKKIWATQYRPALASSGSIQAAPSAGAAAGAPASAATSRSNVTLGRQPSASTAREESYTRPRPMPSASAPGSVHPNFAYCRASQST